MDSPGQNAAMEQKLRLAFPLLSDRGGEGAIKPYGVWHAEPEIARPAIVIVLASGEEAFRQVGSDFADRLSEDDLVDVVRGLGLPPVTQEPPRTGTAEPGERAMPVRAMDPYYRGARFAAVALRERVPEAREDADALVSEMDRYREAVKLLRE